MPQQANPRTAVNSPHSGQSRRSPGATAGIPRISPGPCWAAVSVTHHLLPEDTAAESQNGTPTPEPTWGRCGSQVETARPHSGWGARRSGPVCGRGRSEPNRLNSATSCPKTHVENSSSGVPSVCLFTSCPAFLPGLGFPFFYISVSESFDWLFDRVSVNRKQVRRVGELF